MIPLAEDLNKKELNYVCKDSYIESNPVEIPSLVELEMLEKQNKRHLNYHKYPRKCKYNNQGFQCLVSLA
jgi:hypothetical protein